MTTLIIHTYTLILACFPGIDIFQNIIEENLNVKFALIRFLRRILG